MTTKQDATDIRVEAEQQSQNKRITKIEQAIIQINHFTEIIEGLDLGTWKADVNADLRWLKWVLGIGVTVVLIILGKLIVG